MSNNLGVGKTLELLERLRGTVREFTARADKLNADFQARTAREQRLREAAAEKEAKELAVAIGDAETAFAIGKEALETRHEARKTRIGKAYQSSKEKALVDIETQTGTRKYELQKAMLQAERDRSAALAAAATALQEFQANAAAENAALASLEAAAYKSFRGYRALVRLLAEAYEKVSTPHASKDEHQLLAELRELLGTTSGDLSRFRRIVLVRIFKYLAVWVLLVLCEIPLVLQRYGLNAPAYQKAALCAGGSLVVVLVLRYLAVSQSRQSAAAVAGQLAKARRLHDTSLERAEAHYQQELERIKTEFENSTRTADQQLKRALAEAGELRVACRMASDEKASRALETHDRQRRAELNQLQQRHSESTEQLKRTGEARRKAEVEASQKREAQFSADYQTQWQTLEAEWKSSDSTDLRGNRVGERAGRGVIPSLAASRSGELEPAGRVWRSSKVRAAGRGGGKARGGHDQGQTPGVARACPVFGAALPGLSGAGLHPVRDGRPAATMRPLARLTISSCACSRRRLPAG